jgi:CTP:molybdopterin cytidylyltransferase MocA
MSGLNLVMPMAGRGSRFAKLGILEPKPLIDLGGKPFFWWAVESVRRVVDVETMVFVVLDEHKRAHRIDERIHAFYPDARIVSIPDVTSGAAETARIGVDALTSDGPVAINDCDHAFLCPGLAAMPATLSADADMALLCFRSSNPAYSYAILDDAGQPTGTIEKVVASPFAIAGCYMFRSAALFSRIYQAYGKDCPYDELFISGMFNRGAIDGTSMVKLEAARHWSFGTPDELAGTDQRQIAAAFNISDQP